MNNLNEKPSRRRKAYIFIRRKYKLSLKIFKNIQCNTLCEHFSMTNMYDYHN